MLQLDGEDLAIPAGLLGELVVGEDVGALLRLGQMLEPDARHGLEAELLRGFDAAVAGDDAVPALSMRTGLLKPNALMLAAISAICFGLWVRALRA